MPLEYTVSITRLATKYISPGVSERRKHSRTILQNTFHFVLNPDILSSVF